MDTVRKWEEKILLPNWWWRKKFHSRWSHPATQRLGGCGRKVALWFWLRAQEAGKAACQQSPRWAPDTSPDTVLRKCCCGGRGRNGHASSLDLRNWPEDRSEENGIYDCFPFKRFPVSHQHSHLEAAQPLALETVSSQRSPLTSGVTLASHLTWMPSHVICRT